MEGYERYANKLEFGNYDISGTCIGSHPQGLHIELFTSISRNHVCSKFFSSYQNQPCCLRFSYTNHEASIQWSEIVYSQGGCPKFAIPTHLNGSNLGWCKFENGRNSLLHVLFGLVVSAFNAALASYSNIRSAFRHVPRLGPRTCTCTLYSSNTRLSLLSLESQNPLDCC